MARQAAALFAGLLAAGYFLPAAFAEPRKDPAHALAQEFAAGGEAQAKLQRKAEEAKRRSAEKAREATRRAALAKRKASEARLAAERLKADEAEMLERARAEANDRLAEQRRARDEIDRAERDRADAEIRAAEAARKEEDGRAARALEQVKEAEERRAAAERQAREAETRRHAEEQKAEEARVAAEEALRREEERRVQAERRLREAQEKAAEAERLAKDAEERRIAEERRAETAVTEAAREIEELRRQTEERRREADREAAASRLYGDAREPLDGERGARQGLGGPEPSRHARGEDHGDDAYDEEDTPDHVGRVAILLKMDPGNRGIRRFGRKTADPMICVGGDRCYISEGPSSPAKELSRRKAFGAGVALGTRAGACRNSLVCVFRDVDLGDASALLQPVDLRILRHDRRETRLVSADRTCVLPGGLLSCADPVVAKDYRAWIVPERVARRAGPEELEGALDDGLGESGGRRAENR